MRGILSPTREGFVYCNVDTAYLLSCDQNASSSSSGNSVNGMPLGVAHPLATMYPKQYACWWSSDANIQGIGVNNIDPVLRYHYALQKVASLKKILLCMSYRWLSARLQYLHC